MMWLCVLQHMVPDFIIIIIGLYLAYIGSHVLDGLLQKKGADLVICNKPLVLTLNSLIARAKNTYLDHMGLCER